MNDASSPSTAPHSYAGKLFLITVLLLALSMAGFSVWYRHQTTRRSLAFWGPEAGQLIIRSNRVELLRLTPLPDRASPVDPAEQLTLLGQPFAVGSRQDIAEAKGLVHIRRALLEDASFAWEERKPACAPTWPYALAFRSEGGAAIIGLDLECGQATLAGKDSSVSMTPIARGLRSFIDEQKPK